MKKQKNDGKCPICGKTVTVLWGPDSYVYKNYRFYHPECIRAKKGEELEGEKGK